MIIKKILWILGLSILFCMVAWGSLWPIVSTPRAAMPASVCPQIVGDQFYLTDERYLLKGLNYYHKDHPWDLFWDFWHDENNRDEIAAELDMAHDLGVNSLRIFLRWENFTSTVRLEAKQDLDEFLELAASKEMKVLITLFDGMPNEGPESLYIDPITGTQHLDSFFTPFENKGRIVEFSQDCRILGWDVKNEPDRDYYKDANGDGLHGVDLVSARPDDEAAVQAWVDTMIGHLRTKDNLHPVTVGVYGAISATTYIYDPTIAGYYTTIITHPVDFVSMHYSLPETNFPADVDAVETIAGGKPLVIEEFALHTWSDHPGDPHKLRDQAAYLNAILSTAEAKHSAGSMVWTLTDFSYIMAGDSEHLKHVGILHNELVTTTEVLAPIDYGEKPAAAVVREHFKSDIAWLDSLDGYALLDNDNCDPPVGFSDNRTDQGAVLMTCAATAHDFAPSQAGRGSFIKLGGAVEGVITSPVVEAVDVNHHQQIIVDLLTYTVHTTHNVGPVNLDIGVQATGEGVPTWLAPDLVAASVDVTRGLKLPQTISVPLPAGWSTEKDFWVMLRLQDHIPGDTGYSAGFELGSLQIGACSATPTPLVQLDEELKVVFGDDFNGRGIDTAVWEIVHGVPYLFNCSAVLTTTRIPNWPSKTELRSTRSFGPTATLIIGASTQNWQGDNKEGDSSFGFEGWDDNCHYAVIVTSDGKLGLIRPEEGVDCQQPNPSLRECYLDIQDWDTLRPALHEFAIAWSPTNVTLSIDGVSNVTWDDDQPAAGCIAPMVSQIPLPIRLNANVFNEDRERLPGEENHYDRDILWVDYVYVYQRTIYLPIILREATF